MKTTIPFKVMVISILLSLFFTSCATYEKVMNVSIHGAVIHYYGDSPTPPESLFPGADISYYYIEKIFFPFNFYSADAHSPSLVRPTYFVDANYPSSVIQPNLDETKILASANPLNQEVAFSSGPQYSTQPSAIPEYFDRSESKSASNYLTLIEGLEFVGKGGKQTFGSSTTSTRIYYLEAPVTLNYNQEVINGKYVLYGGLGPYLGLGLFGSFNTNGQKESVKFGKNGDFNRMDYGGRFDIGCVYAKKWDLSVAYDLGLKNLIGGIWAAGDYAKNRSISLNIGYRFK